MSARDKEARRAAAVGPPLDGLYEPPDLPWSVFYKTKEYALNEPQKEALRDLAWANGGACALAVGKGKSLLALLIPKLFGIPGKKTLLLAPKNLERNFLGQYNKFKDHFHVEKPSIVSFELWQGKTAYNTVRKARPSLIIVDEAQGLKRASSKRFKLLLKYLQEFPDTIVVMLTATISSRAIQEMTHILLAALRDNAPLPLEGQALTTWGRILNAQEKPLARDWSYFQPMFDRYSYGLKVTSKKGAREILKRHLAQVPGLTINGESSSSATLYIKKVKHIGIPDRIQKVLEYMDTHKRLPANGDYFESPSAEAAARIQVLHGFYYKWVWDPSVSQSDITDWKLARSDWNRACRQILETNQLGPVLSVADLVDLILKTPGEAEKIRVGICDLYKAWRYEADRTPHPETVGVWLDDYLIEWTQRWLSVMPPTLIWYGPKIVGRMFSERLGLPWYKGGSPPPVEGEEGTGDHSGMVHLCHRRGLNLQAWYNHLVITPPAGGGVWEQLLGRGRRQGQSKDVRYEVLCHHPALDRRVEVARQDATWAVDGLGMDQNLKDAIWV